MSLRSGKAALFLFISCISTVTAQQQPASQQPVDIGQEPTFKSRTEIVNVIFNVKDKRGALIPALPKEQFEVYEDGVKQEIKFFSADTNLPLTLGVLIDTSGSQARVLPMEKEVGSEFLREVLREKDLAFAINFDVNVELLQDFTSNPSDLRSALESTRINTGGGIGGGPGIGQGPIPIPDQRGTLLYDAIYLASNEKLSREVGRKALIILTDGADYGSRMRIADAIESAQKADAIVYVLLVADPPFYGGGGYSGQGEMKKLTQETGGRMIEVGDDRRDLKAAFDQISNELRNQYSIGYTPLNQKRDGSFRKIEIKTKAGKVQARRGYYAPKE